MKIVFSRKGFDTASGGGPSPIIDGRPVSLPIPGSNGETTTYADRGLADAVAIASRGKHAGETACHDDPMFVDGQCWLGQIGAAQGHLRNQGVGEGDVFVFFGLFAEPLTGERHHRIFGAMTVGCFGSPQETRRHPSWQEPPRRHPHLHGDWGASNAVYHGAGRLATSASARLRLTHREGPLNRWVVPNWLRDLGLTYHPEKSRWAAEGELNSVKRGQEFVCQIGDAEEPRHWLEGILAEIGREP